MNKAKLICRYFAAGYQKFLSVDGQAREKAERLTQIINNGQAMVCDREEAVAELEHLLFPTGPNLQPVSDSFGERVDAIMRQRGLNQRDLALAIGMHVSAVYVMLSRRCYKPWRRTVKRVADALGVAPTELWPNDLTD